MKRTLYLLVTASVLLTSCVGNTSLWGQYQTPTPVGWIPENATPIPVSTDTFLPDVDFPTVTPFPSPTATPLANFVTRDATSQPAVDVVTSTADGNSILYYAQGGDWLPAVASRFGVSVNEITSPKILPERGYIDAGTLLIIPNRLDETVLYTPAVQFIPDSEVVFSATSAGFDIDQYVQDAGGYLSTYREWLNTTEWTTGAGEIERLAYENSINPRLLLALLDYEANWVRGTPEDQFRMDYPLGHENYRNKGMFGQLTWGVNQISMGYYGWRQGTITELVFTDGKKLPLDPTLNAGTVAVMTLFSRHHSLNEWLRIMDVNSGFPFFYQNMFGDPWGRADAIGNFFPPGMSQPKMTLPFEWGKTWSFTGGPHSAWGTDGPLAAIDFAPENDTPGCFVTESWILALAPGLVVRSANGVVVIDMDGDGSEQTGWNIMYLHIANKDRVALGQWVEQDGLIGHASCEGGRSTGTHTHIARKYNGEWMLADGPIPFTMDGWTVLAGDEPYLGKLLKGNNIVTADVYGQAWSLVTREDE
ncbi:MAG TPA: M23 family metallopeptidase [Anaerolineales bacterium]|nr:M23 family metallopeptidase [Anaerolineales bacterium]